MGEDFKERIEDVLRMSEVGILEGSLTDTEAIKYAIDHGLVQRKYHGVSGLLGLATLHRTMQPVPIQED